MINFKVTKPKGRKKHYTITIDNSKSNIPIEYASKAIVAVMGSGNISRNSTRILVTKKSPETYLPKIRKKIYSAGNTMEGGLGAGHSIDDLAKKYKVKPIHYKKIYSAIDAGIGVEKEHTNDIERMKEIAFDHLWETGMLYYQELSKMEKKLERNPVKFEKGDEVGNEIEKVSILFENIKNSIGDDKSPYSNHVKVLNSVDIEIIKKRIEHDEVLLNELKDKQNKIDTEKKAKRKELSNNGYNNFEINSNYDIRKYVENEKILESKIDILRHNIGELKDVLELINRFRNEEKTEKKLKDVIEYVEAHMDDETNKDQYWAKQNEMKLLLNTFVKSVHFKTGENANIYFLKDVYKKFGLDFIKRTEGVVLKKAEDLDADFRQEEASKLQQEWKQQNPNTVMPREVQDEISKRLYAISIDKLDYFINLAKSELGYKTENIDSEKGKGDEVKDRMRMLALKAKADADALALLELEMEMESGVEAKEEPKPEKKNNTLPENKYFDEIIEDVINKGEKERFKRKNAITGEEKSGDRYRMSYKGFDAKNKRRIIEKMASEINLSQNERAELLTSGNIIYYKDYFVWIRQPKMKGEADYFDVSVEKFDEQITEKTAQPEAEENDKLQKFVNEVTFDQLFKNEVEIPSELFDAYDEFVATGKFTYNDDVADYFIQKFNLENNPEKVKTVVYWVSQNIKKREAKAYFDKMISEGWNVLSNDELEKLSKSKAKITIDKDIKGIKYFNVVEGSDGNYVLVHSKSKKSGYSPYSSNPLYPTLYKLYSESTETKPVEIEPETAPQKEAWEISVTDYIKNKSRGKEITDDERKYLLENYIEAVEKAVSEGKPVSEKIQNRLESLKKAASQRSNVQDDVLRVDDRVIVKGKNGNPDYEGSFRGWSNGEAVVWIESIGSQWSVPKDEVYKKGTQVELETKPKEAWEMTFDEFIESEIKSTQERLKTEYDPRKIDAYKYGLEQLINRNEIELNDKREYFHKPIIEKALSEGKPVPAEVLADYPELQKSEPEANDEVKQIEKDLISGKMTASDYIDAGYSKKYGYYGSDDFKKKFPDFIKHKKSDKNIGREWNSPYGRQKITDVIIHATGDMYVVETVDTGAERNYSVGKIEDTIKNDEYRLTDEYKVKSEEQQQLQKSIREAQERRDAELKKERDELYVFLKDSPAMQKERLTLAMLKSYMLNGKTNTLKKHIEEFIRNGAVVKTVDGERRLYVEERGFFDQKAISKVGMDYAEYLLLNKEKMSAGGFIKCPVGTQVQSVLMSKDNFSRKEAVSWIKDHDYKAGVDETENYYRFRQQEPEEFDNESFRTIEFTDGIKAVIGCPINKKMERGDAVKYDRKGNEIGEGSWHIEPEVFEFPEYPQIKSSVDYSQSTESTYVTYLNTENDRKITVRFSQHESNAVRFGDQLDGNFASKNEILYHLGLKKREFIPNKHLYIQNRMVAKRDIPKYEEADKTIQEMYALGANADISMYNGKIAKGSNYLIMGDTVEEIIDTRQDPFGNPVELGKYVYSDIDEIKTKAEKGMKIDTDTNGGAAYEGNLHTEGGIPATVKETGQEIEFEVGEIVINRVDAQKHCEELSKINSEHGKPINCECLRNQNKEANLKDPKMEGEIDEKTGMVKLERGAEIDKNMDKVLNNQGNIIQDTIENQQIEEMETATLFENGGAISNLGYSLLGELWFAVHERYSEKYRKIADKLNSENVSFAIQNRVAADAEENRYRKAIDTAEVADRIKKIVAGKYDIRYENGDKIGGKQRHYKFRDDSFFVVDWVEQDGKQVAVLVDKQPRNKWFSIGESSADQILEDAKKEGLSFDEMLKTLIQNGAFVNIHAEGSAISGEYPHPFVKAIDEQIIKAGKEYRAMEDAIYGLAGDRNKQKRQEVISAIVGEKVPVAKSGISAIEIELKKWILAKYPNANVTKRFEPILKEEAKADTTEKEAWEMTIDEYVEEKSKDIPEGSISDLRAEFHNEYYNAIQKHLESNGQISQRVYEQLEPIFQNRVVAKYRNPISGTEPKTETIPENIPIEVAKSNEYQEAYSRYERGEISSDELTSFGKALSEKQLKVADENSEWENILLTMIPNAQKKMMSVSEDFEVNKERLISQLKAMPKLYGQDGKKGDAIAYFHYFVGSLDIYLMEFSKSDDESSPYEFYTFGSAVEGGDFEGSYAYFPDWLSFTPKNIEFDYYFEPTPLRNIQDERNPYYEKEQEAPTADKEMVNIRTKIYSNAYEQNKGIEKFIELAGENTVFTGEDIEFMNRYTGYGGLGKFMDVETVQRTEAVGTLYEYYTPDELCKKLWGLAYKHGFDASQLVLEPSCGIGRIIKYAPNKSLVKAYETNPTSSFIAKATYRGSDIVNDYFESEFYMGFGKRTRNKDYAPAYGLVIGNYPFGDYSGKYASMGEKDYSKATQVDHHFIVRGLDALVSGGLMVCIVNSRFMQGGHDAVKAEIEKRGELIDAYRLPAGVFQNTEVIADILVIRKK